ncbi:AAA family ATPase [Methylocaldum sp.]|uniref:AAA family ATPase n=1 Tax=Methylocaldum sp. TaxID=1969727 RepID=UPI002D581117|nr:AAA family ATPase [Methylocaldum sp.]HYE38170.1 AAA family ATPase [Methylocaldum sp.]
MDASTQAAAPTPSEDTAIYIPGPKTLLVGGTGTGKTHSLRTLVAQGLEVFALFTEPGMEVVADIPTDKLKWHYIPPASPDWADMLDSATKINSMSLKMISGMEDINKRKYQGFMDVVRVLGNFVDERTGQSFGPVDKFDAKRVLWIDSLSGLNILAMNLVTGSKPVKSMADWGMAMDNLERLLTKLCVDVPCPVVLVAHAERETDEVTGGTTLMASTLGKKLAPRLPRFFSDVINVKRDGDKFTWSTMTHNMDLKARNIPLADNLAPTFEPIIKAWKARNEEARKARNGG